MRKRHTNTNTKQALYNIRVYSAIRKYSIFTACFTVKEHPATNQYFTTKEHIAAKECFTITQNFLMKY